MTGEEPKSGWDPSLVRYVVAVGLSLLLAFAAVAVFSYRNAGAWREDRSPPFQTAPEGKQWREYSPELAHAIHKEGRAVLIHLTADWSRQSQENRVLLSGDPTLRRLFDDGSVVPLLANIRSKKGAVLAEEYNLAAQPAVIAWPGDNEPKVFKGAIQIHALLPFLEHRKATPLSR